MRHYTKNDTLIIAAILGGLCGMSLLLAFFCILRCKLWRSEFAPHTQNSINSSTAIAIRIEETLPSDQRPGL